MNIGMGDGVDCDEQVSFENQDLGYFDLESHKVQALDNPFGPKVLTM
jgi:hypothetical protein